MADAFKSNSTPVRSSLGGADAESSGNNVVAFFTTIQRCLSQEPRDLVYPE
uniref:Uncharacterized protein n=1 Tax=Brassica oleracea TaxID=3712 RepID=A0A3P6DUR2_BRAOL|nr:unnamed protein product [Brassica oleracea]